MKNSIYGVYLLVVFSSVMKAQNNTDAIVGKWMSEEKNLLVEVYKVNTEFKGKIIWFDDTDDKSRPYYTRLDSRNPDKNLKSRKIIGMEVLHGLIYNANEDEWQDGKIYDASSGKDWNAKVWIAKDGSLKVRGFWHFEFLGQNICFTKYNK